MRFFAILFSFLFFAAPALAEDKYNFDKSHTRILFFISHLGFSETVGDFTDYDGWFIFNEQEPAKSMVDVTLKPAGIHTVSPKLDEHLQSADFFNTAKYPTIHFVSKSIKVTGAKTGEITGDLTILGVTKPVTLNVTFNKADFFPMTGNYVAGFSAKTTIKRSDFGMNYSIPMVGDEVRVEIYTEGIHESKKQPAKHE